MRTLRATRSRRLLAVELLEDRRLLTNDPPTLDPIIDRSIDEDSGTQIVQLSGVTAGAGALQPLQLTAVSSNSTLISSVPFFATTGGFGAAQRYSAQNTTHGVTAGDFDGDGNLDIAVANQGSDSATIVFGDGNGGFSAPVSIDVGSNPYDITSGDFDGDGFHDIVVSNFESNLITIRRGAANRTFYAQQSFPSGDGVAFPASTGVWILKAADVNSDGKLDVLASNQRHDFVSVMLGNGSGGFNTPIKTQTLGAAGGSGSIYGLTVADFNTDGKQDIAVTVRAEDAVKVLLGNNDGTFTLSGTYTVGDNPFEITAGDFDADGVVDLAAVMRTPTTAIYPMWNNGSAIFSVGPAITVGGDWGWSIASGDVDGDGDHDIAFGGPGDGGVIRYLASSGNRTFASLQTFTLDPAGTLEAEDLQLVDVNRDGVLDIIAAANRYGQTGAIGVLLGSQPSYRLSFSPAADRVGQSVITVTVEDGGNDRNLATKNDNATFSRSFTVTVNSVNDRPLLDPSFSPVVGSVLEGARDPSGITVAEIVVDGSVIDADGTAIEAIAITGINTTFGTWQYQLVGNSTWLTIDAGLINSELTEQVLLLGPSAKLRLVPFGSLTGSLSDALTFRAWDQSAGVEGQYTGIANTGSVIGPGNINATHVDGAYDVIAVDLNNPAVLSAGDYVASSFNYQFSNFPGLTTTGTITPLLVTGGGTDFVPVAIGNSIMYSGVTDFTSVSFRGIDSFTLSSSTTVYSALYWKATYTQGADLRMPVGFRNNIGNVFSIFGGGTGPGANKPMIGTSISGSGQGFFQRVYDFSIGVSRAAISPGDTAFSSATDVASLTVTPVNSAPTFAPVSGTGKLLVPVNSNNDFGRSVILQPDGRIILAGSSFDGAKNDFSLIRLETDGSLDMTFDSDGKKFVSVGNFDSLGEGASLQPDGKIVVVGSSSNGANDDFAIIRLNTDGSLDTSFGSNGKQIVQPYLGDDRAYLSIIQPDGRILVAGQSWTGSQWDTSLIRLNSNGLLDTSFDGDGILIVPADGRNIALQSDGRILVAGYVWNAGVQDFVLTRLNADGSLDTSFDGDGRVTVPVGPYLTGSSMIIQPNGRILIGGYASNGYNQDFSLIRLNTDGSLDSSFDSDGKLLVPVGSSTDYGRSMTLQPDGKILLSGISDNDGNQDFSVIRVNSNGSLDDSFSGDGKLIVPVGDGEDAAYAMVLQPDGKMLLAGHSYSNINSTFDFSLIRLNSDGSLDTTFNGVSVHTLGGTVSYEENGTPVVLDNDVRVFDTELSAANSFAGATLTLSRNGGSNAEDLFSATSTLGTLTQGGALIIDGTTIGTVTTNGSGILAMVFNANASNTLVNAVVQKIAYSNSSDAPPSSVQIRWVFSDGNSGDQGSGGSLTGDGSTTVNITVVNDAPSDISLSTNAIAEGAGANATVGTLSTTDPDAGNTFTYTLVAGTGGADNSDFNIDGTTLRANRSFYYETKPSYSIRVRSTDQDGLFTEKSFTINVTNILEDLVVTAASGVGPGTLSQMIQIANNQAGPDRIVFALSMNTVQPSADLPSITEPLVIDGENRVMLNGTDSPSDGLTVSAPNTSILNLTIANYVNGSGVAFTGASHGKVQGTKIGTNQTGTAALPNQRGIWISNSVNILVGTDGIGIDNASERNVISGNSGNGISVVGTSKNVTVAGNYIGLDVDGAAGLGNAGSGVSITGGTEGILVGGTATAARNVISSNSLQGIHIEGSSIDTVRIEGNYIGTDVSGTVDVGNKQNGIYVLDAKNTLIRDSVVLGNDLSGIVISGGSNHTLERNVVSGNGVDGIQMLGTTDSLVSQNTIGLNANRSAVAANTRYGLYVSGSMRNTIDRNYASGNHFGIYVFSSSDCTLTGNVVGLLGDGYTVARNEYFGIFIDRSHRTRVGTNGDGVQDAQERNVVTGQWKNIFVENSQDTVVAGNFVGTSVTGVLPSVVVPDTTGVHVRSSERTRVGTDGSNDNNNSNERNVLTGNSKGVWVELSAIDTVIAGNFIGISSEGMQLSYGNTMGIYVDNGPTNTRIGSDINGVRDAEERNIISGNEYGVHIYGTTTTGTWIRSNYIGSSVSGTVAIANGIGVYLDRAGSTSMVNNVISGNGSAVVGGSSRDISLTGNLIGTAPDGLATLANGQGLSFNASGSITIGGTTTEARNIIANSAGSGISLGSMDGSLGATTVQGNYIGVNASGTTAAGNAFGIRVIDSPGVTIGGGISEARNVVSGNNQGGIAIVGDKSTNITVAGNYVGTNAAGTVAVGNKNFGIFVGDGDLIGITNTTSAKGVTIGGTSAGARNIISGNAGTGLQIGGSGADDNIVIGNYIGLASDGQTAIANAGIGISVYQGAKGTRIGTDADGQNDSREGNVISGNRAGGIVIDGNGTEDSVIAGNFVGTDSNGNTAIENRNSGVWIFNGAKNNLVGGSTAASRNVISGNRLAGVAVESVGTTGNVIRGNWIGTNATGTAAVPNLEAGVGLINRSSGTSVLNNVVSGNRTMGIGLGAFGGLTEGSHNNLIFGNLVGTDPSGMFALPNQGVGIVLRDKSSGNTVGGTTAAERNIISANTTGGIQLLHSNTSNNVILGNYVGIGADGNLPLGNGAAGILVSSGASSNRIGGTAAGSGNAISANLTHGIHISGTTTSTTTVQGNQVGINAPGTLDRGNAFFGLFIEDSGGHTIGGNASGAGNVISGNDRGGVAIIGGSSTNITVAGNLIGTNAAGMAAIGNGAFGVLIGSGPIVGQPNTGTARNNTVGGSATGSGNTISGNGGPGVWIASGGAAGNNVAGNLIGTDKLGVQAIGNQTGVLLSLGAQDNVIGGAAANSRNIISGNIGSGVRIIDANSSGNSILSNWIGLNATGDVPLANTLYGIEIAQGASANQLLDNLVSGNNLGGIKLGDTTTGNTLARNRVGLNSGGTLAIGNGAEGLGIWITNATDNMIGGESATLGNFIVGNRGDGIRISGNSTLNRIEGNDFGLTNSPTNLGNGRHGIVLDGVEVKNNTIGGTSSNRANNFRFAGVAGLRATGSTATLAANNKLGSNLFDDNGSLAIDIGSLGLTSNDAGDADLLTNAPVIVSAVLSGTGALVLEGYSRPGQTIHFYRTANQANKRGQGRSRLASFAEGSVDDKSNGTGFYELVEVGSDTSAHSFRFEIPNATSANGLNVQLADLVTAVATGATSGFSEFGNIAVVTEEANNQPPQVVINPPAGVDAGNPIVTRTGEPLQLTGSFVDLDSTNWSGTVDYGDGKGPESLALTLQNTFELNRIYRKASAENLTITVVVTDANGKVGTATLPVRVLNDAPIISASDLEFGRRINEGDTLRAKGRFSDTGTEETHRVTIQWGDGISSSVDLAAGVFDFELNHIYADDGVSNTPRDNYNFVVTVSDEGGATATATGVTVTEVANLRPSNLTIDLTGLSLESGVPVLSEGSTFQLKGSFKDLGLMDSHKMSIDFGDGTPPQTITVDGRNAERAFSAAHVYKDNPAAGETYEIRIDVSDDDEPSELTTLKQLVKVQNVAPQIPEGTTGLQLSKAEVLENEEVSLDISFTDPGVNDTHEVRIDWNDGSPVQVVTLAAGTRNLRGLKYTYGDNQQNESPYQISATVIDNAGAAVTRTIGLVVKNAAPLIGATQLYMRENNEWKPVSSGSAIVEGTEVKLTGSFTDRSLLDTHTVTVRWAEYQDRDAVTGSLLFNPDGSPKMKQEKFLANVNSEARTFETIYTYRDDYAVNTTSDSYDIRIEVRDDDGGIAVDDKSRITISNVAPVGLFVPKQGSTPDKYTFIPVITDPGTEFFTYEWKAFNVSTGNLVETGALFEFDVIPSKYAGATIRVTLAVMDDDGGRFDYSSVLLPGTDGAETITIQDTSFVGDQRNLTVLSFDGADIVDASKITDPAKNVVIDGGKGKDLLFGGKGNDTLILRDGDDIANPQGVLSQNGVPINPTYEGDDTYILVPNSTLTIIDPEGANTLDFSRAGFGIEFDLTKTIGLASSPQTVSTAGGREHVVDARGGDLGFRGLQGSFFGDRFKAISGARINAGSGEDIITVPEGTVGGAFSGGADNDVFDIRGTGISGIDLRGDTGADIFNIGGALNGISFSGGADNDIFNIASGAFSNITFAGGADGDPFGGVQDLDSFNISGGTFDQIVFSAGADNDVFNISGGTFTGIAFGGGADNDAFTITGGSFNGISFAGGADNDVFHVYGGVFQGGIDFSGDAGFDQVFILKPSNLVSPEDYEIPGRFRFNGGADNDLFVLGSGVNIGGIDFQGGADTDELQVLGKVFGGITFEGGADNDVFTIGSGGRVEGTIDFNGDIGNDALTIVGSAGGITFAGGADNDVFTLGSGGSVSSIVFGGGADNDLLQIEGTVSGGITFAGGADNDVLVMSTGSRSGNIDFNGDVGNDALTIVGTAGNITFIGGADNDVFSLGSGGTISGIVFGGGADNDLLQIVGTVSGGINFQGGADNDVFLMATGSASGNIDFNGDTGSDILDIRGHSGGIDFRGGADNDLLSISGNASGIIDFNGDVGNDVFSISGTVNGGITFSGGADKDLFTITGAAEGIAFTGGADNDTLRILGTTGQIDFRGDDGDDQIGVSANARVISSANEIGLKFEGGNGSDRLINYSSNVASLVFYGNTGSEFDADSLDGDDLFVQYGAAAQSVTFYGQQGNDTFLNYGSDIQNLSFYGGAGNNIFIVDGNNINELTFQGGNGSDSFSLAGAGLGKVTFGGDLDLANGSRDTLIISASGKKDENSNSVGEIFFYGMAGDDVMRNDGTDWSRLVFNGGAGNDAMQNNGQVDLVHFIGTDGNDFVENTQDDIDGLLFLGDVGDDVFINRGDNARNLFLYGGAGDDSYLNTGGNTENLWVIEQSGENRFLNQGESSRNVFFQGGLGSDTFVNSSKSSQSLTFWGNQGGDRFVNEFQNNVGAENASKISFLDSGIASIPDLNPFGWANAVPDQPPAGADNSNDVFLNRAPGVSIVTFDGGDGNDFFQNSGSNVSNVIFQGGNGDDQALNSKTASRLIDFSFIGGAGNDAFQNDGDAAGILKFYGDAGNDSLYQNGAGAKTIEGVRTTEVNFFAGDGVNIFVNWGADVGKLSMTGGTGADRLQNNADRVGAIQFVDQPRQSGGFSFARSNINGIQNTGSYIDEMLVLGGGAADSLINIGDYVKYMELDGGDGPDSLVNSGNVIGDLAATNGKNGLRFVGGAGADVLRTQGVGLTRVDFDGGSNADALVYNTTSGGNISYSGGAGEDGFVLRGDAERIDIDLGDGNDRFVIQGEVQSKADDTNASMKLIGGNGDDWYEFSRYPKGFVEVVEGFSGIGDPSRDTLNFEYYLDQAVVLDLQSNSKQQVGSFFWLRFAGTQGSLQQGVEDVVGSQFGDTIWGNSRNNRLSGAAYTNSKPSDTPVAKRSDTQWVLLDFDSQTNAQDDKDAKRDEYVYTEMDRENILLGLKRAYWGTDATGALRKGNDRWFNVQFTTNGSEIPETYRGTTGNPKSDYATIRFNETPPNGYAGGLASEIDYGNTRLGGIAVVQIHGLLGGIAQPPVLSIDRGDIVGDFLNPNMDGALTFGERNPENNVANFVGLSIKVAAHELGHLLGLRHYDAFGPIGSGIHSPPGNGSFNPYFTGLSEAYETFQHLISSPASVGSDRQNDLQGLFFGEREAIKLAYAFSDPAVTRTIENSSAKGNKNSAQSVPWKTIAVPNTLLTGVHRDHNLYAQTLTVAGSISFDGEKDYYKINGKAGDLVTIEVGSFAMRRLSHPNGGSGLTPTGSADQASFIDSTLRLYSADGKLVGYNEGNEAYNDDEFESTDSILLDVRLPSDGDYYIEVGAFLSDDIGNYELSAYRFAKENRVDGRNILKGRGGIDSFAGSTLDNFQLRIPSNALSNAAAKEGLAYAGNVSFIDDGGNSWRAEIDYRDGKPPVILTSINPSTGIPLSYNFLDDGAYTVVVTLTNDDGQAASRSFTIAVDNLEPTASIQSTANSIESTTAVVTMTGTDSAGDRGSLRYIISTDRNARDNASYESLKDTSSQSKSISLANSPSVDVYMRVIDKDGGIADYDRTISLITSLDGTLGDDTFVATYTGNGTAHAWSVSRNGTNVFSGSAGIGGLIIDGLGGTDILQVKGLSTGDIFQLDSNQIITNGALTRFANFKSLNIFGGSGNDELTVNANAEIGMNRSFDGEAGIDTIKGVRGDTTWNITGSGSGNIDSISNLSFQAIESVTGGIGNDQFVFGPSGQLAGRILGGSGNDTLNLAAKTNAHIVDLQSNTSTSTGGIGGIESFIGSSASTASDLLIGVNERTTWLVDALNAGSLSSVRTGLIAFSGFESLTGGTADDTFVFAHAGSLSGAVTGGTAAGAVDRIDLSAKTAALDFRLNASTNSVDGVIGTNYNGIEQIKGNSVAGSRVTRVNEVATTWSVNSSGQILEGGVIYSNVRTIVGNPGSLSDTLTGPAVPSTWTVDAVNGGTLDIGSARISFTGIENLTGNAAADAFVFANSGSISGVVTGGTGPGIIDRIDLSAKTAALEFRMNASTNSVDGAIGTNYTGIEEITGSSVAGTKLTRVSNAATSWAVTSSGRIVVGGVTYSDVSAIEGGQGADTITGPDLANTWTISGANRGALALSHAAIVFAGVENLTGGSAADHFEIQPTGSISGAINGGTGAGLNSLSYAQWTSGVTVNLSIVTAGNARGISGLTSNFQLVIGGTGDDTLTGNASKSTILVGLAGRDTLVGGSQQDLILGGLNADTIRGNNGDDLLIAGTTAFDTDRAALLAIYAEWISNRTFAQRTANLWGNGSGTRANGNRFLNNAADNITDTVFADSDVDTLLGGSGQDWFFASLGSDTTDFLGTGPAPDRRN